MRVVSRGSAILRTGRVRIGEIRAWLTERSPELIQPETRESILQEMILQILHDQLHWLDVPDRVLFKLAVTVHQCLNGRAPPYLSEHCIPVSSADTRWHLRSANRHLLAVPRFRLNTYGRRAFSAAGPMAWNSLPDFIRDPTSSTDCFRRLLKTY